MLDFVHGRATIFKFYYYFAVVVVILDEIKFFDVISGCFGNTGISSSRIRSSGHLAVDRIAYHSLKGFRSVF